MAAANTLHSTVHPVHARLPARARTLHSQVHLVTLSHVDAVVDDFYGAVAPAPPTKLLGTEAPVMLSYLPAYYP